MAVLPVDKAVSATVIALVPAVVIVNVPVLVAESASVYDMLVKVIPPANAPARVSVSPVDSRKLFVDTSAVALVSVTKPVPEPVTVDPKFPASSSSEAEIAALPVKVNAVFKLETE